METLKTLLENINPHLTEEQLYRQFEEIARALLQGYWIVNQGKAYALTDVEFYYYSPKIDDARLSDTSATVTYKRDCEAGMWFFHSSGMDLCFKSNSSEGYGGGILIRGIKDMESGAIISGPQKCYGQLFDYYVDALNPTSYPYLRPLELGKINCVEIISDKRVNTEHLDKYHRNWRFKVKL